MGITMASLLLGMIAEPTIAHKLEPLLHDLGAGEALVHPISFAVALSIVAYLHMVVGEMVPKSLAIASPEAALVAIALPMRAFVRLVRPLNTILTHLSNLFLRLIRVEPKLCRMPTAALCRPWAFRSRSGKARSFFGRPRRLPWREISPVTM